MSLPRDLTRFHGAERGQLAELFRSALHEEKSERTRAYRLAFDEALRSLRTGTLERQRDLASAIDEALGIGETAADLEPEEIARWRTLGELLDQAYTRAGAARAPAALRSHAKYGRRLLDLLASRGGSCPRAQLAADLGLKGANAAILSRMLTDLDDAGLVRRERDGRSVTVHLTAEGRSQAGAREDWPAALALLLDDLRADPVGLPDEETMSARLQSIGASPGSATRRLAEALLDLLRPAVDVLALPSIPAASVRFWENQRAHRVSWSTLPELSSPTQSNAFAQRRGGHAGPVSDEFRAL